MENTKLLYQIKGLEKIITRKLLDNSEIEHKEFAIIPTPTQMQILAYIMKNQDKDIYQKDLESVLNLRRATVSGVLQTMEKNNLIQRVVDSEDSRIKKIILNPKAEKLFKENQKRVEKLEKIISEGISEEEVLIFSKVIKKMKENVQKHDIT